MQPLTGEWVAKAEGDFVTALREVEVQDHPNYDAVCFHTQQCAEKYLKARLIEAGIPFSRTHNLIALLNLFSVQMRYPGESADEAVAHCRVVRDAARRSLGLEA